MTDGLPIVPPTEEKVRRTLDYVGLQGPDVVAREEIRSKVFTAEKVAINAVMAGCEPEYMPVVVAAVKAMAERSFNLHASSTSTDGAGILALVSGPVAAELGINSGTVLMGHGRRANASIGRALALIKINVLGSTPDEMDKSTFGHPDDYTFCFAEADEATPWEPLRVEKGSTVESSTVTAFAAGSPLQASTHEYREPEEFLTIVADAILGMGPRHSDALVVLSPELLGYIREAGWSKQQVKEFVFQKAQRTGREWNAWNRFREPFVGQDLDTRLPAVESVDEITVVGAGGAAGAFASIIRSWSGSRSVTREIAKGR